MIVLAGDIGGTHARMARFQFEEGRPGELVDEWTSPSAHYSGPAPVVKEYLTQRGLSARDLRGLCVAVAGPIRDGVLRVPNLGWKLEVAGFGSDVGFPGATLLNDFVAVGHGLSMLQDTDFAEIQEGTAREGAPVAVLGPGTGLGHAYLVWEEGAYRIESSEGGHADFAPRTPTQWALAEYLRERYGHASCERVISGPGLLNVYRFLAAKAPAEEVAEVREEIESGDPPAIISRHGAAGTDALCERAFEIFLAVLGAHAGNLALTLQAHGGVYIAGGIARQIVGALRGGPFLDCFRSKGRLSELLEAIPVRVVLNERVGLLGAARVGALFRDPLDL